MTERQWPTREEWQAKAEYSVRTLCTRWERLPHDARFITAEEEAEALAWALEAAKRLRPPLTAEINRLRVLVPDRPAAGRARVRWWLDLSEEKERVANDLSALEDIRRTVARAAREKAWDTVGGQLGRLYRHQRRIMLDGGLDELCERLNARAVEVAARRDAEAVRLEQKAIEREVARRATDEAWEKELEWRARVEQPRVTRISSGYGE
ncbi:hypothetical protein AB0958_18910 [Streptomyces sp. NPDC006655]|uniref:hypothetical protein n=1 Tax=Streptomyces sp. NPDC006655 TaxID=3156898 RepID=UPI003454824D